MLFVSVIFVKSVCHIYVYVGFVKAVFSICLISTFTFLRKVEGFCAHTHIGICRIVSEWLKSLLSKSKYKKSYFPDPFSVHCSHYIFADNYLKLSFVKVLNNRLTMNKLKPTRNVYWFYQVVN